MLFVAIQLYIRQEDAHAARTRALQILQCYYSRNQQQLAHACISCVHPTRSFWFCGAYMHAYMYSMHACTRRILCIAQPQMHTRAGPQSNCGPECAEASRPNVCILLVRRSVCSWCAVWWWSVCSGLSPHFNGQLRAYTIEYTIYYSSLHLSAICVDDDDDGMQRQARRHFKAPPLNKLTTMLAEEK